MDLIVKVNSQSAGRDKIARIIQYASKMIWNEMTTSKSNIYLIEKLQILETTCGNFRKILRFGRCFDIFYSAFSSLKNQELILQITLTLSKVANSLFLFADHIVWLSRSGFLKNVDANKWNIISNRYWVLNLIMNILRDLYEIHKILYSDNIVGNFKKGVCGDPLNVQVYLSFLRNTMNALCLRQDVLIDTIKNCCDIWIPLTALRRVKLKPGTVGLLGTISSFAALLTIAKPVTKLLPA